MTILPILSTIKHEIKRAHLCMHCVLSPAFHCYAQPLNKVICAVIGQEASQWVGQPCLSCCSVHVLSCALSSSLLVLKIRHSHFYHFCPILPFRDFVFFFILKTHILFYHFSLPTITPIYYSASHTLPTHSPSDTNKQTSV